MYKKRTVYQVLVETGLVKSKKEAVILARNNKIIVDGKVVVSLHYQFNPRKKKILVNGREVKLEDKRNYFIFNKPEGVVTTKENILNFLKNHVEKDSLFSYYPVGRLDKDTSGLLIITNDGRLGNKILNPRQKILKVYEVVISGKLSDDDVKNLSEGVEIELEENGVFRKYKTLPSRIKIISKKSQSQQSCGAFFTPKNEHSTTDAKQRGINPFVENKDIVEVEISEGKKRQVRKMFQAVGCKVLKLKRVKIGNLELGDLNPGEIKKILRDILLKSIF